MFGSHDSYEGFRFDDKVFVLNFQFIKQSIFDVNVSWDINIRLITIINVWKKSDSIRHTETSHQMSMKCIELNAQMDR